MNAAGIRALEQARGYYAEGVASATKRVREARKALAEAEEQLKKAQTEAGQLDEAIKEAKGVES